MKLKRKVKGKGKMMMRQSFDPLSMRRKEEHQKMMR
jgi:hypothetical protein